MRTMATSTPSALVPLMPPATYRKLALIWRRSLSDNEACRQKRKRIGIIVDEEVGRAVEQRGSRMSRNRVRVREAGYGGEESQRRRATEGRRRRRPRGGGGGRGLRQERHRDRQAQAHDQERPED